VYIVLMLLFYFGVEGIYFFLVAITIYWGVWLLRFHNFVCARGQSRVNII